MTLVRNVQGYTRASPRFILEVTCTVPTICFNSVVFKWFMYQQYVYGVASCCPLVVYEL